MPSLFGFFKSQSNSWSPSNIAEFQQALTVRTINLIKKVGGTGAVGSVAQDWLLSKRNTYKNIPTQYQEQLEKNSVYFVEATASSQVALVLYLCKGKPQIAPRKIRGFVRKVGVDTPIKNSVPIISYISGNYAKRPNQISPMAWDRIRELRQGPRNVYIHELEVMCLKYNAATTLTDSLLTAFLREPAMRGCLNRFEQVQINEIIWRHILEWANYCTHDIVDELVG